MSSLKTLIMLCTGILALSVIAPAPAATFTVDRTDDTAVSTCSATVNDCTLRGAVTKANATIGADIILFDTTVFATSQTITLNTKLDKLSGDITITGPGADKLTIKNTTTGSKFSIFTFSTLVNASFSATFSGFTISDSSVGLSVVPGVTVTATNCVFSGNTVGISSSGVATATNCTFSNNSTGVSNGNGTFTTTNCTVSGNTNYGVLNEANGTVTATNCTVSSNSGYGIISEGPAIVTGCTISGNGSGIYGFSGTSTVTGCTLSGNTTGLTIAGGTMTLKNSLVVGNTTNVSGAFTDGGFNITSGTATAAGLQTDAGGAPVLASNGGPTQTIALLTGSAAIDKGGSGGPATDQRGFNRPFNDAAIAPAAGGDDSDIGAFELGGLPAASVNNPRSLVEGSAAAPGSITLDITLNAASTQSVTVNYQTLNGTNNPAIAGSDYNTKAGKLTFLPGETLKRVTIFFIGDSTVELNETFFVDLLTPSNAILGDSRGVGTLVNDDGPGLTVEDALSIDEGNSGTTAQQFIVRLSAVSTDTVTVEWTTADNTAVAPDYVVASGILTFTPGQTSKIVTVLVNGDTTVESNEIYKVNLSKPTYSFLADATGLGTIRNDDPNLIIEDAVTIDEGDSTTSGQQFIVRLSTASLSTVTVDWATAISSAVATDFVTATGTLTFAPGQTSKIITILVNGDMTVEPDETYTVNLTNVVSAFIADSQGLGVIRNDD